VKSGRVVRIGRDDAEGAGLRVEQNGKNQIALGEFLGDLVERQLIDIRFGKLFRRNEARLIVIGEIFEERGLVARRCAERVPVRALVAPA
jgi:hypothetical protein